MLENYFQPIEEAVAAKEFSVERIGGRILKYTSCEGFPNLEGVQLAIFTLADNGKENLFREYFYQFFIGNWNITIADLGNFSEGKTDKDTEMGIKEIVNDLISIGITPIIIGKKQEVTYGMYRAFDKMEQLVNLVCVDTIFDFGNHQEFVSPDSYMSRILMEEPTNLYHFANIGYQTYYNAQETLDVVEQMYFEAYRLGEVTHCLELVEPVMRDADIVSIDMRSVQASDLDWAAGYPSGFTNREVCAITRYAGLSMKTSVFGVFEIPNTPRALQLLGQMVWYFIEGYNYRIKEFPTLNDPNFIKYNVLCSEDLVIKFYKSIRTGRWWILPSEYANGMQMLPCMEQDYKEAANGIIPQRWWNLYKKAIL